MPHHKTLIHFSIKISNKMNKYLKEVKKSSILNLNN